MATEKAAAKPRSARNKTDEEIKRSEEDRRIVLEKLTKRGSVTADTPALLYKELGLGTHEMTIARFNSATFMLSESGKIRYHRKKLEDQRSFDDQVRPITLTVIK